MKTKYILFFLLLLQASGCVTIVKWKYGITEPAMQSPATLLSYLKKHHYPDSGQFIFNDSSSYLGSFRDTAWNDHLFSHMIFDNSGSLIRRDTSKCQWSGYEVVRTLNTDSVYVKSGGPHLAEITDHISPIGPVQAKEPSLLPPDFTVVVTWARFIGKLNSRLFELDKAGKENGTARVRMIWLNVDMQKSWELTKEQQMKIR